ncbi:MAG: hypothetical protein HQM10_18435 [Candidatus Riflebacteria bacterium]|nr:hypothetical protein [Candidatus Riflebacteria bacterium]
MLRLSFVFGFFLSITVSSIVFLLSIMAKVTLASLIFKTLVTFFMFGILGVALGSFLEVVLMPEVMKAENARAHQEIGETDTEIEKELGDLLYSKKMEDENKKSGFKPTVFPKFTSENGQLVSNDDSAVTS